MKKIQAINKLVGQFLRQGGGSVTQAIIKGNKEGTYRWAQSFVTLPDGSKFMIKVYPVGPEAQE